MVSKRQHFKKLLENDSSFELIDTVFECIQDNYKLGLTLILTCSASMTNINGIFNRFDLDSYFKVWEMKWKGKDEDTQLALREIKVAYYNCRS